MITDEMKEEIEHAVKESVQRELIRLNIAKSGGEGYSAIVFRVQDFEEVKGRVLPRGEPIAITNVPPHKNNEHEVFLIIGDGRTSVEFLNPRMAKTFSRL